MHYTHRAHLFQIQNYLVQGPLHVFYNEGTVICPHCQVPEAIEIYECSAEL